MAAASMGYSTILNDDSVQRVELEIDQIEVLPASTLPDNLKSIWFNFVQSNADLSSPYFHPAFSECAAAVRSNSEVAVFYRQQKPVGFFPFHRVDGDEAIPVGGRLNDYQGVIASQPLRVSARDLLNAGRLKRCEFHAWHWPQPQRAGWGPSVPIVATWADLRGGSARYLGLIRNRSVALRRHDQKSRKLARDCRDLSFVVDERDPALLDWLIDNKREKYARTGCTDYFAPDWTRQLMHKLLATDRWGFRGLLSVVYGFGRPLAAHFGMIANHTLHYWFPVYDPQFGKYSPGTELYLRIAEASDRLGITRIDFGYGDEPYKARLTTHRDRLWKGSWDASWTRSRWHWTVEQVAQHVKRSRWKNLIKNACRTIVPNLGKPVIR